MKSSIQRAILFILAAGVGLFATESPAQEPVDPQHSEKMAKGLEIFKTQVRALLVNRCLDCHGPAEAESEFDLSTRAKLLEGGVLGDSVVPGKPQESLLVELIKHKQEPEMPYEEAKLKDAEIAAIEKWIELGAPYDSPLAGGDETPWTERKIDPSARDYWAFQPLAEVRPPQVKGDWPRNEIDAFVLAKLLDAGVEPNDAASRRTLIRRAYFDLIGLPPTPEEVQAFIKDDDPQAYAKLIDKLLASEHYGERWGRHWLDVARFAESHGFEQDYDRKHAYHYRDFVIQALNQDMPYNQFVRWQLAGDELAPDEPLAMMATGFLGAGVFPTQLTEKEFEPARYDELDDMLGTTGTAMLGLTIGCARCHDHKFDPIPQADYYRMLSTFTTAIRSEIDIEMSSPEQRSKAKAEHAKKLADLTTALENFEAQQLPKLLDEYVANLNGEAVVPQDWTLLPITAAHGERGTKFALQADGAALKQGPTVAKDTFLLTASTQAKNITALRLEALTHDSFPRRGPGLAGNGNFCLSHIEVTAAPAGKPDEAKPVKLVAPRATHQQDGGNLSAAASLDGDRANSGWAVDRGGIGKDQAVLFAFEKPVGFDGGTLLTAKLVFDHSNTKHLMGHIRLATTSADPATVALRGKQAAVPEAVVATLRKLKAGEAVDQAARSATLAWFATTNPQWQKLNSALQTHKAAAASAGGKKVKVMVTSEGLPKLKHHADGRGFTHFYPKTYFLKRGDATQKVKEADQSFLQALVRGDATPDRWLMEKPEGSRTSHRRHALADWMVDTEHGAGHLLARVIVNRMWHHHFGRGLVATPNDFGRQAEPPSHPQLLDYLAGRLIDSGWRLKPMHKLIMTSAAYTQSSQHRAEAERIDEQNRLVWRYSPRRLEAEVIRDSMLHVAGQLDTTMYGPGTLDEGMKRRSIYFFIKRSRLIPMMQLFDQPEPLVSQADRPATTIAPQALLFMNNPHVRGYAKAFAARVAGSEQTPLTDSVKQAYQLALSRQPSEEELNDGVAFLTEQIAAYEESKTAGAKQLALADFCQVLFGLNEFVFID